MPRGKELEQLPMANIAPSIGEDRSKYNRENLSGIVSKEEPKPSNAGKNNQSS